MKPNTVFVWSSGLEQWEPTNLVPVLDTGKMTFIQTKIFSHGKINIFQDNLKRFFATYSEFSK
jgi:hypothetical protein